MKKKKRILTREERERILRSYSQNNLNNNSVINRPLISTVPTDLPIDNRSQTSADNSQYNILPELKKIFFIVFIIVIILIGLVIADKKTTYFTSFGAKISHLLGL